MVGSHHTLATLWGLFEQIIRQVLGAQDFGRAQNDRTLDHVLELAHVAWPVVLGKDLTMPSCTH